MTATLRGLVSEAHPHHLMEPLDATAPTDLLLESPTVIIEVVGAREGIDALARVRRVVNDAPVAAVRISAMDTHGHLDRATPPRRGAPLAWLAVLAVAVIVAIRVSAAVGLPTSAIVSATVGVGAPLLIVTSLRAWRRARRAPAVRRRHFERRRSITVIAVSSLDETTASSLASSVRRELDSAHTGDSHYEVSVFDPPPCGRSPGGGPTAN